MIKNIFFNGLSDVINIITGIVSSIVLVRILGSTQWGYYSQINWLIGFTGAFFSLGLTYTATRYFSMLSGQNNIAELRSLVGCIILIQLLSALVGGVALFLSAPYLIALMGWKLDSSLVKIAGLALFSFALIQLSLAMMRGLQKFQSLSVLTLLLNLIMIGALAITIIYPSISIFILCITIGQIVLIPIIFVQIWQYISSERVNIRISKIKLPTQWRAITKYTALVFISMLVDQIVWQRSEIFFLAQLPDASASGYYGLAYTSAQLAIGTIPLALTGILTPQFSSLVNSKDSTSIVESYRHAFSLLNWILLPLSIIFFITAPNLITFLYGSSYDPVIPVLRILIVSSAIGIYARPSASVLHAINKPQILLIGSLLALPVDLILAWRLVPLWGAQGAAIANVAAQVVGATFAIGYTTILAGMRYDLQSLGKSMVGVLVCGITTWLITLIFKSPVLSVIVASAVGAFTYLLMLTWLNDRITHDAIRCLQRMASSRLSFFVS